MHEKRIPMAVHDTAVWHCACVGRHLVVEDAHNVCIRLVILTCTK